MIPTETPSPEKSKKSRKSMDDKSKKNIVPFFVSPIAIPMADEKFSKKCYKITKKATKDKDIKRGVKEVVKAIRKGQKGLLYISFEYDCSIFFL
jgi:H/ACA ribonucleoprotein complex subunit 2